MSTEERERDDWKAAANGWEERAERVTAERDEARATVERVSALLARWEDPDTMEIDIGDLRAALSPAGGSEKEKIRPSRPTPVPTRTANPTPPPSTYRRCPMQSTTADTTRHLATLWRGAEAWHWTALYTGHAQPLGHRNYARSRHDWRFHFTPLCASNYYGKWTLGLCLGKRTIYLYSHR